MNEEQIEQACRKLCELQGENPDELVQINTTPPRPTTKYASGLEVTYAVHIIPTYKKVPRWETYKPAIVYQDNITNALAYGKHMAPQATSNEP